MQKYEVFVQEYLTQNGNISLERIGHLTYADGNTDFIYDKKAATTPEFIVYVAEKMGKNKSLVGFDIESHIEQARQFINLGKPYIIPKLGGISLTKNGTYTFDQQQTITAGEEEYLTEQAALSVEKDKKKKGVMALAIMLLLFILGAIGYGIYYVVSSTPASDAAITIEQDSTLPADQTAVQTDTAVSRKPDSLTTVSTITDSSFTKNDSASGIFKFVFEQTRFRNRAIKRTGDLTRWGRIAAYDSIMYRDSLLYRLYVPVTASAADTAVIKDSLQKYFQRRVKIIQ